MRVTSPSGEYFLRIVIGFDVNWTREDDEAQNRLVEMIVGSLRSVR